MYGAGIHLQTFGGASGSERSSSCSGRAVLRQHRCSQPLGGWKYSSTGEKRQGICLRCEPSDKSNGSSPSGHGGDGEEYSRTLPQYFDFASEPDIYRQWESSGLMSPRAAKEGEGLEDTFVVMMPPPNVTGKLHMGHAIGSTLQDIMIRHARMRGLRALFLPGADHAGIATQSVVEKMLSQEGVTRQELGREAFVGRVWEWKAEYGGYIQNQLRRLGVSCDWTRERFTLDEGLSEAVVEAFLRLHKAGLLYRGSYMVNWSPVLGTAISDMEVEYKEEEGSLYFFRYPVADSDSFLPVATTRPETILGDSAVAVNPEDPRYKEFVGRECCVPGTGRRIPIIADTYVDMEFGTGALKITPAHDYNDYEIGKRFNLPMLTVMTWTGHMNEEAGKYAGMERSECRKALWADLEEAGLADRVEPYKLNAPRSQRSGEIIEPMVSMQWFVKLEPLLTPVRKLLEEGAVQFFPARFDSSIFQWIDNTTNDWCISRQLWYVFESEEQLAASPDGRSSVLVVARSEAEAYEQARKEHGEHVVLNRESDVLDTWFSSGLWPFSSLGWPSQSSPDLAQFHPGTCLETGYDILFFWVLRMLFMGHFLTGQLPFRHVYLHGLVRDGQGRKMSKSLGNVLDPLDIMDQYGADGVRFVLATASTPGTDLSLQEQQLQEGRNLINKLWNAAKFVLMNLKDVTAEEWDTLGSVEYRTPAQVATLAVPEKWIVSRLHGVVDQYDTYLAKYDFANAGRALFDLFWREFADWYIETAKERLYKGTPEARSQARGVLVYTLTTIVKLFHPYMPYVTERIYAALPRAASASPLLIGAAFPAAGGVRDPGAERTYAAIIDAVTDLRRTRRQFDVPEKRAIAATLYVADDTLQESLTQEAGSLCLLGKVDPEAIQFKSGTAADVELKEGDTQVVVNADVIAVIPLAGLVDAEKELARLAKQKKKLEKQIASGEKQLGNAEFVAKAKPEFVAARREGIEALKAEVKTVEEAEQQMRQLAGVSQ